MKVIHVIRDTADWDNLTLDNYFDQPFDNDLVKNEMIEMIRKWDVAMTPSYFKFRSVITKIAFKNHDRLDVDIRFSSSNNLEYELKSIPKPYIVLFVDDDDWHNPEVVQMLKDEYSKDQNLDAMVWDHFVFLTNYKSFNWEKKEPYFLNANRGYFHTNNYALTDRFWDNLTEYDLEYLYKGVDCDLCYGHNMIDRRFKPLMNYKELYGRGVCSIANKTITSYSSFLKKRNDLLNELSNIVLKCQTSQLEIPDEISWAKEEIKETMELYKTMQVKRTM